MKVTLGDLANKLNKIIAADPKCGKMYISDVECASRNGYVAGYNEAMRESIPKEYIKKWSLDHYPWTTVTLQEIKRTEVMRMVDDWEKENEGLV